MSKDDRKYVIITIEDVEDIDFNQVLDDGPETLVISKNSEYTFVKFIGDTPSFLEGKTQYTRKEMRSKIQDSNDIWLTSDQEQPTITNKLQDVVSGITWDKLNPFNWL
tara:strand:+ start:1587 stop:1910 length:324 start_codon:yes stop_codon:yes gene_type:complete